MYQYREIVFSKYIDRDFEAMLKPLIYVQNIFLFPVYRIKNDFITPNSITVKIMTALGIILLLAINFARTVLAFTYERTSMVHHARWLSLFDVFYLPIGLYIGYKDMVLESSSQVELIMRLQRITNSNFKHSKKKYLPSNWPFCIWLLIIHMLLQIPLVINQKTVLISFTMYMTKKFDLSVIYASRMIHLTRRNLELWNLELRKISSLSIQDLRKTHPELYWRTMLKRYLEIMETLKFIEKCFTKSVSIKFFQNDRNNKNLVISFLNNIIILDLPMP